MTFNLNNDTSSRVMTRLGTGIKIDVTNTDRNSLIQQKIDLHELHNYLDLRDGGSWELVSQPAFSLFFHFIAVQDNRYLIICIDPQKFRPNAIHKRTIAVKDKHSEKFIDIICEINTCFQGEIDLYPAAHTILSLLFEGTVNTMAAFISDRW